MKSLLIAALSFTSLALAAPADAQQTRGAGPDRRTVIDMEADVIEGTLKAPDGLVVREPIHKEFRTLIQLRRDFRREVLASCAQL